MIRPYVTPPGFRDTPYIYVFDPNALRNVYSFAADGDNLYEATTAQMQNLSQPIQQGETFLLRRVNPSFFPIGPLVPADGPGGLKMRDAIRQDRFSAQRPLSPTDYSPDGTPMNFSLPIIPEAAYPPRGSINFDLYGARLRYNAATPNVDANTVPISQLLFQGVRRYPYNAPDNRPLPAGWEERPYIYPIDILVNWPYWAGGVVANGESPPHRFTIPISDWDFELLDIRVLRDYATGTPGPNPTNTVEVARITLYDWALNALSSAPVNLNAINSANTAGFSNGVGGTAGAGALCPPVLYPNRSNIQFDLVSLLNPANTPVSEFELREGGLLKDPPPPGTGVVITIQFIGRRRWPQ